MLIKLKSAFIALSFLTVVGSFFSGSAVADPICGTLEECRSLRVYLQEELVEQESEAVRAFLRSQLTEVDARIEELCKSPDPEKRETTTGAVFTRDRSHAALNEAWRDQDGLIWGDIVKKTDGTVHTMNHSEATNYCTSIGARLPSKEEFIRLREYMGARSGMHEGYSHHDDKILPNLSNYWFWSSSVDPLDADFAYVFYGSFGYIYKSLRFRSNNSAVRCVVGR